MKFEIEIPDELMDGLDYAAGKENAKGETQYDRRNYIEFVMTKACENYVYQKERGI